MNAHIVHCESANGMTLMKRECEKGPTTDGVGCNEVSGMMNYADNLGNRLLKGPYGIVYRIVTWTVLYREVMRGRDVSCRTCINVRVPEGGREGRFDLTRERMRILESANLQARQRSWD